MFCRTRLVYAAAIIIIAARVEFADRCLPRAVAFKRQQETRQTEPSRTPHAACYFTPGVHFNAGVVKMSSTRNLVRHLSRGSRWFLMLNRRRKQCEHVTQAVGGRKCRLCTTTICVETQAKDGVPAGRHANSTVILNVNDKRNSPHALAFAQYLISPRTTHGRRQERTVLTARNEYAFVIYVGRLQVVGRRLHGGGNGSGGAKQAGLTVNREWRSRTESTNGEVLLLKTIVETKQRVAAPPHVECIGYIASVSPRWRTGRIQSRGTR